MLKNNKLPLLQKLLCSSAYYFDDQLYRFKLHDDGHLELIPVAHTEKMLPILIVAHQLYAESAKSYPIDDKKEATKLLKLEHLAPEQMFHIWSAKDQHTLVNSWKFSTGLPKALVTLPETLLLALTGEHNQISVIKKQCTEMYVGRVNQQIYSAVKGGLINSLERFAISTGIQQVNNVRTVEAAQFAETLLSAFDRNSFTWLFSFINWRNNFDVKNILLKIFTPMTLVFSSYLLLTSGYLLINNALLKNEMASQKNDVSQALTQQQQFDNNAARFNRISEFLNAQNNSALLWVVLNELYEKASFSNVRIENERYVLRGSAEKATDLLVHLSNIEGVFDAKFDYPTRNSRGKDVFVISFLIKKDSKDELVKDGHNG